jgi:hypothetical protein
MDRVMRKKVFDLEQAAAFCRAEARRRHALGDEWMELTALTHADHLDAIAAGLRAEASTVEPCYRCADVQVGP